MCATMFVCAGIVAAKLSSADEAGEALHVCTMAMEVVVVLFNHEAGGHRVCRPVCDGEPGGWMSGWMCPHQCRLFGWFDPVARCPH
jgi:hypothetical protein